MTKRVLTVAITLILMNSAQARPYNLPAAPLGSTLSKIAADAGIALSFPPALTQGKRSAAVAGDYSPEEALRQALGTHALSLTREADGRYQIRSTTGEDASTSLAPIIVYGDQAALSGLLTDQQGYDAVYDDNYSSDYSGKQRIDTYRGTNPADLLHSFAGIYSGDARNSGAIDPNIRGLQGEGRIKVRVDGTEQALSVNRGYNGASNRNYVDPLLTSSIRVVKDSGLDTGVDTGIGGGLDIHTLGVNDFIGEEGGFGGEIRFESASNGVKPRIGQDYDGTLLKNIPGYHIINTEISSEIPLSDEDIPQPRWEGKRSHLQSHNSKTGSDVNNLFKGQDYAGRIALGYKGENWDVMAAYAKRKRGNYFSGKHGADYYKAYPLEPDEKGYTGDGDPIRVLAHRLPPGSEVFNTSNDMTSYLFKAGWQPTEEQSLRLNLRRTETRYGEIMPSRMRISNNDDVGVQWPLSHVDLNAYSLQYHLNPADNDWLNFHANLWQTDTKSHLYNSGGEVAKIIDQGTAPRDPDDVSPSFAFDPDTSKMSFIYKWDTTKLEDDMMINNAVVDSKHTRKGFDLSNRMRLSDTLNLTLIGSFQKEKLDSDIKYFPDVTSWAQLPRKGERQEYGLGFNFNWQPNDRLSVDLGAKYASYWIHDDFLAAHIDDPVAKGKYVFDKTEYYYKYYTKTPEQVKNYSKNNIKPLQSYLDQFDEGMAIYEGRIPSKYPEHYNPERWNPDNLSREEWAQKNYEEISLTAVDRWKGKEHSIVWQTDENGRLTRANNPCMNGMIANTPYVVPPEKGNYCTGTLHEHSVEAKNRTVDKVRAHAWTPAIAINYKINDDARVYARYNESVRYPSAFEGLVGGFSIFSDGTPLRPERSHKFELGYVHNLLRYFPDAEAADFKLAYYQNRIKDVIDRTEYQSRNFEEQKIKGLELQARYDNGRYFGELGLDYQLQNQLCDEHSAALLQAERERIAERAALQRPAIPRCVKDGFYNTFSLTHATPDFSAKLHLGARLFERKLELGSRLTYYPEKDNKDYDRHIWLLGVDPTEEGKGNNVAYGWGKTFLVDAYARYKFNDHFSMEFAGSNLTDQYFVDPATRTSIPGPGRTFKLSFTGHF